jgi:hypothetical protein
MAAVLTLPFKWIVFALPMHAIDATDHARESSSLIDRPSVLNSWGSQVKFDEHHIHGSKKPVHGIKEGATTNSLVLVEDITRHSI